MRRSGEHRVLVKAFAPIVLSLLLAAPAYGSITVGSPLTAPMFSTSTCGNTGGCTRANTALGDAGAHLTSPVTGTVVRWRIAGSYSGTFRLRVLRPAGGGQYRGAGTSPPTTANGTTTLTVAANLPIEPGDLVAMDYGDGHHLESAMVSGSAFEVWEPALADGETEAPTPFATNLELLYNADVEPSSAFTIGKPVLNKRRGTATVALNLANAGEVSASGKGASAAGATSSNAVGPGAAQLLIRSKGRKRRTLNGTGRVKLNLAITYTPTGGAANTQSLRLKLKKKI